MYTIRTESNRSTITISIDPVKVRQCDSISLMDWRLIPKFKAIVRPYLEKLEEDQIKHLLKLWIYNQDKDNLTALIEDVVSDHDLPVFTTISVSS